MYVLLRAHSAAVRTVDSFPVHRCFYANPAYSPLNNYERRPHLLYTVHLRPDHILFAEESVRSWFIYDPNYVNLTQFVSMVKTGTCRTVKDVLLYLNVDRLKQQRWEKLAWLPNDVFDKVVNTVQRCIHHIAVVCEGDREEEEDEEQEMQRVYEMRDIDIIDMFLAFMALAPSEDVAYSAIACLYMVNSKLQDGLGCDYYTNDTTFVAWIVVLTHLQHQFMHMYTSVLQHRADSLLPSSSTTTTNASTKGIRGLMETLHHVEQSEGIYAIYENLWYGDMQRRAEFIFKYFPIIDHLYHFIRTGLSSDQQHPDSTIASLLTNQLNDCKKEIRSSRQARRLTRAQYEQMANKKTINTDDIASTVRSKLKSLSFNSSSQRPIHIVDNDTESVDFHLTHRLVMYTMLRLYQQYSAAIRCYVFIHFHQINLLPRTNAVFSGDTNETNAIRDKIDALALYTQQQVTEIKQHASKLPRIDDGIKQSIDNLVQYVSHSSSSSSSSLLPTLHSDDDDVQSHIKCRRCSTPFVCNACQQQQSQGSKMYYNDNTNMYCSFDCIEQHTKLINDLIGNALEEAEASTALASLASSSTTTATTTTTTTAASSHPNDDDVLVVYAKFKVV